MSFVMDKSKSTKGASVQRDFSFSTEVQWESQNKSATSGARLVLIGIPTICPYNLEPNHINKALEGDPQVSHIPLNILKSIPYP